MVWNSYCCVAGEASRDADFAGISEWVEPEPVRLVNAKISARGPSVVPLLWNIMELGVDHEG